MIRFRTSPPPANQMDIFNLEEQIGNSLPHDYRQFLLSANGGSQPFKETFPIPGEGTGVIQVLFGFYPGYDNLVEVISRHDFIFPQAIPIARDLCGNHIILALTESIFGKVYWWNHELQPGGIGQEPILIANSFSEFFAHFDEPS